MLFYFYTLFVCFLLPVCAESEGWMPRIHAKRHGEIFNQASNKRGFREKLPPGSPRYKRNFERQRDKKTNTVSYLNLDTSRRAPYRLIKYRKVNKRYDLPRKCKGEELKTYGDLVICAQTIFTQHTSNSAGSIVTVSDLMRPLAPYQLCRSDQEYIEKWVAYFPLKYHYLDIKLAVESKGQHLDTETQKLLYDRVKSYRHYLWDHFRQFIRDRVENISYGSLVGVFREVERNGLSGYREVDNIGNNFARVYGVIEDFEIKNPHKMLPRVSVIREMLDKWVKAYKDLIKIRANRGHDVYLEEREKHWDQLYSLVDIILQGTFSVDNNLLSFKDFLENEKLKGLNLDIRDNRVTQDSREVVLPPIRPLTKSARRHSSPSRSNRWSDRSSNSWSSKSVSSRGSRTGSIYSGSSLSSVSSGSVQGPIAPPKISKENSRNSFRRYSTI